MPRKTVSRAETKKALVQVGTPIYDSVVADLQCDPSAMCEVPARAAHASPTAVAAKLDRKRRMATV
jgi:hypothetical protein